MQLSELFRKSPSLTEHKENLNELITLTINKFLFLHSTGFFLCFEECVSLFSYEISYAEDWLALTHSNGIEGDPRYQTDEEFGSPVGLTYSVGGLPLLSRLFLNPLMFIVSLQALL